MRKVKSIYSRTFDSTCKNWEDHREYNRVYLKAAEQYFNMILKARGYVFYGIFMNT